MPMYIDGHTTVPDGVLSKNSGLKNGSTTSETILELCNSTSLSDQSSGMTPSQSATKISLVLRYLTQVLLELVKLHLLDVETLGDAMTFFSLSLLARAEYGNAAALLYFVFLFLEPLSWDWCSSV